MGEGTYYPGGPKCRYNGKIVDCLTYVSESGGITGDILVETLKYFDDIDLFPCIAGGPIPLLIWTQSLLSTSMMKSINGKFV